MYVVRERKIDSVSSFLIFSRCQEWRAEVCVLTNNELSMYIKDENKNHFY